ncbi:MAG: NAD-dependent epimerase/dehydratase family protein [Actinobacteria bacterium]|nr:NAD-dependent epimerase/dehydratase family protein [Actinomycetota bacterium]
MTAVITGASGHLGVSLIRALVERGTAVRAVVHRNAAPLEGLGVEVVRGDVLDPASLREAFDGAAAVYHLAAVISITGDPDGTVARVNVEGAANAAAAARDARVGRFVHCSSIHAFDLAAGAPVVDESSPRVPHGSRRHPAYDRSKADGERRVREEIAAGLDGVIVHPTSIIGPDDHEPSRMGRFFLGLRDRTLPALVRGAFDFVDVRDVAAAMVAAAARGRRGRSYILGGRTRTVAEMAALARQIAGVRPPRLVLPRGVARLGLPFIAAAAKVRKVEPLYTAESLDALALRSRIDHGLAARELGFTARPLEDTVRDIYRWFERD